MERYEFDCEGDRLVGNLHLAQGDAHGVAILTGPLTSVKEQASGAWASALAERGFVSLSFDHRNFGESAGCTAVTYSTAISALALFERRPHQRSTRSSTPASENLHNSGSPLARCR